MSIFGINIPGFFGSSQSEADGFARELDYWVGVRRACLDLGGRWDRIVTKALSLPNDWEGTSAAISRAMAANSGLMSLLDQVAAHDRHLSGLVAECERAESLTPEQATKVRSLLGLEGLGVLPAIYFFYLFAASVIALVGSRVASDHRQKTADIANEKRVVEAVLAGEERALDLAIEQALASGKPVVMPSRASVDAVVNGDPITKAVASAASGVGTLAVVGVALWAAAKMFGGSKK